VGSLAVKVELNERPPAAVNPFGSDVGDGELAIIDQAETTNPWFGNQPRQDQDHSLGNTIGGGEFS
jgi:hypothetical protein